MEHSKYLIGKAVSLMMNPMVRSRYQETSEKLSHYMLEQKSLLKTFTKKSGLSVDEIQDLIQSSATILSFSGLIGWDLGSRVNTIEALKGAAIGATIGLCLVVGHMVIRIFLRKQENGFTVRDLKVEEATLDEQVAAYP